MRMLSHHQHHAGATSLLDECRPDWRDTMAAELVTILDRLEATDVEAGE
jgi:hypothetical protein